MKLKRILGILIALGVIGGILGYIQYNKPHKDMSKLSVEYQLTADQLFHAFDENENAANETYLGKIVAVSGNVKEINLEEEPGYIFLETSSLLSVVKCQMDHLSEHPTLKNIEVGDQINAKGSVSGYLTDVILDRCIITK